MSKLRGGARTRVLLLGPQLDAVSGVSTHLNQLFGSELRNDFGLSHFQVGSERLTFSPLRLAARIIRDRPDIVHINASLDHKSFPRDATYLAVAKTLGRQAIFQVHSGGNTGGVLPRTVWI